MRRRDGKGHSLLEMVLAIFIFLSIVVGIMGIWSTYALSIQKARSVLVATHLGEKVMESCIAAKFANIDELALSYPQDIVTRAKLRGTNIDVKYNLQVIVHPSISPETKDVEVIVTWSEKMSTSTQMRDLSFNTMLSSKG